MTFVPSPTYAQLVDDSVALPGLSGPTAVNLNPAEFTTRHVQAAAVTFLSGKLISPKVKVLPRLSTIEAQMLAVSAHIALRA